MKYTFHSHFAQDIQAYISLRESIGYKGYSYDRSLHLFDRFCMTHFPDTLRRNLLKRGVRKRIAKR